MRFALVFLTMFAVAGNLAAREWKDDKGKFSIQAKLKEIHTDDVLLEKDDGKTIKVSFNRLSDKDKEYILVLSHG